MLIVGISASALILLLALAGYFYIRSGRLNRYMAGQVTEALKEYGLRAEIDKFELTWKLRTATLRDIKLYNQQTGQLIATLDRAEMVTEIHEPYAFRLRREIVFKRLDLSGLKAEVQVDEQGRSNLQGLHQAPPSAPSRITFDFSSLIVALKGGAIHVEDRAHKIEADFGNLNANGGPRPGTQIVDLKLGSDTGQVRYEGRQAGVDGFDLLAHLTDSGADVERFTLRSPMAEATASGRLDDWNAPRYNFGVQARVALDRAAPLIAPGTALRGSAAFDGRVTGEGARYRINGGLTADDLVAAGARLRGVRVDDISVESNGEQLSFTGKHARAQAVAAGGARITDVALGGLYAVMKDGRTQMSTQQATIGRVQVEQGQLSGITVRNLGGMLRDGRYKVSGDLAINGGVLAGAQFGQTRGQLVADNNTVALQQFKAALLGGSATGDLTLQLARGGASRLKASFAGLRTADLYALAAVKQVPLAGTVDGQADVSWPGTNARALSGTISAHLNGQTTAAANVIPVAGDVAIKAAGGTFNFDQLTLATDASTLTATGSLSPSGNSDLRFSLTSTRAEQLQTIASSLTAVQEVIKEYEPQLAGDFKFEGRVTGSLDNPTLEADLNASSIGLHDETLGSLTGHILFSPAEIRFENGQLTAAGGGLAKFTYAAPRAETATAGRLDATLERINVDTLLTAAGLPVKGDVISGVVSGEAHLTGIPGSPVGTATVNLINGTIAGQPAELAQANLVLDGQTARLERVEARLPQGHLTASGNLNLKSNDFQVQGQADNVDLGRLVTALEVTTANVTGTANATFQASGNTKDIGQLKVELNAQGQQVAINGRQAGELRLTARTNPAGRVDIDLVTGIAGKPQPLRASIELRQPGRPFEVESTLTDFDLAPLLDAFAPGLASSIKGNVNGRLRLSGPLENAQGEFTLDGLRGNLTLTAVSLEVGGTPINVETPVTVALNGPQITVERTRFSGQGMNLALGGVLGLREGAGLNFALNGTVNLETLGRLSQDVFVTGTMVVDARLSGTASDPRLAGEVRINDLSLSALDLPVAIEGGTGRIVFSGDKATLESFTARANDGTLQASGTMTLAALQPSEWKFTLTANNVAVDYQGAHATINGELALTGTPQGQLLSGTIRIPQAEYTTNLDLGGLVSNQGGGGLSLDSFGAPGGGTGTFGLAPVRLAVRVEARDSFLVRNEQVNTVASASLNLTGLLNQPDVTGRVTLEGGTIKFRGQRYEITTGTLDLPGGFGAVPLLNLLTESDISGYHVYVGFSGPINDLDVNLRAEPDLTRDEVLALVTTGRTETGTLSSDSILRSGLGTAGSLLSEEFISKPLGHEAEQLLGINRFQIDPVLRPNANPAARLTIGRPIGRNFSFTYSTNLSAEQDQTVLLEYTISNRFSAIASYTQGGSSTQTGSNANAFTIEMRGRKRFSLGFKKDDHLATAPADANRTAAGAPPRLEPPKLPHADVEVEKPQGVKLSDKKMRELLPVTVSGFSRPLARLGERNLTNYLQENGYFFAEVHARCEPANCSGPDLRVFYDVAPGQRLDLQEIRIEGTDKVGKSDVVDELQSKEASFIGSVPYLKNLPFIGGYARGLTSNDRLRRDRETIRRHLADLGYRASRVDWHLAFRPTSPKDLIVIFNVEEGPQSVVADVALRGNAVLPSEELRKTVPIKDAQAFSFTKARESAQQIKNYYAQRGYLDASVEVNVVDLADNRVRLVYDVSEGTRAVTEEVVVSGQTKTHEETIRGFVAAKPGQLITPAKIRLTQRDLYATGAFREVNVRTEPIPGGDETARRILVNVTEAKPLLLGYGLGYSTDDKARGLLEITDTNLLGRLATASLRLRGSRREQLAQLTFSNLRPFGHRWPTTFSAFYDRNANIRSFIPGQTSSSAAGRTFGIHRFAAFVQTEHKLAERTSIRFRYNFENAKLFNLQNIPLTEITRNEKATRLGMFSAGISRDTRDSALNPTKGQLISADHSLAARIFGGNESFNKFFVNYQRYHTVPETVPVLGHSVFAVAARLGLAKAFRVTNRDNDPMISEAEMRLPISERFFAGGATTLRGFRFEEAGPQGILFFDPTNPDAPPTLTRDPNNPKQRAALVPLGGDALAVFNFELRYPLTKHLRLVPFYDLGNVFRRAGDLFGCDRRARDTRNLCVPWTHTVGLGLRINTPLGPVGVDYGYLLNRPTFFTDQDQVVRQQRGVIHIRFGQTF